MWLTRRRRRDIPAVQVVDAVRALAASMRFGLPPAAALAAWPSLAPAEVQPALRRVARRVSLGDAPATAVATAGELGAIAHRLSRCFALQRDAGGSLPAMLDGVAAAAERGESGRARARAATSGARLSGRLVAGLPLAFVPLAPGGGAFRSGAAGIALLGLGVGLAIAGLWWMDRLVPRPAAGDDAVAGLADDLATALDGGIALLPALEAIVAGPAPDLADALARAARRARLGERWVDALACQGPQLAGLAGVLDRSCSRGIPAAAPLRAWARARRAEVETELRRSLQRAPVLMVVPLTVCVLPSFALLAFGPFVLGAVAPR